MNKNLIYETQDEYQELSVFSLEKKNKKRFSRIDLI